MNIWKLFMSIYCLASGISLMFLVTREMISNFYSGWETIVQFLLSGLITLGGIAIWFV